MKANLNSRLYENALAAYAWSMPHFDLETEHAPARVCGVDEAGRGPWAGPVVAACVMFAAPEQIPSGLNDSKKLKPASRDALYEALTECGASYGIGQASAEEIDRLNIWQATQLAMRRAVEAMGVMPEFALIDGKLIPKPFPCPARAVIGGDGISLSIAAASILAKVTRDRMMAEYAQTYPAYGFERHAGYGTEYHQQALATHGICPIHRRSYAPIRAILERSEAA